MKPSTQPFEPPWEPAWVDRAEFNPDWLSRKGHFPIPDGSAAPRFIGTLENAFRYYLRGDLAAKSDGTVLMTTNGNGVLLYAPVATRQHIV